MPHLPPPPGPAVRSLAGGRLSGRWRYERRAGRGIALCYERGTSGAGAAPAAPAPASPARLTPVVHSQRTEPPGRRAPGIRAAPEGRTPAPLTNSSGIRVLCYCGTDFTFDGDAGSCPGCGERAEWPTMNVVEREMRQDLEELLRETEG